MPDARVERIFPGMLEYAGSQEDVCNCLASQRLTSSYRVRGALLQISSRLLKL